MGFKKGKGLGGISLIMIGASVSLAACGRSSDKGNSADDAANSSSSMECRNGTALSSKPGWIQCPDSISSDGSVKVSRQIMNDEEQRKTRDSYQRTNLVQLPVDAKFNAMIYQINGQAEYNHKVFIAPRIFAYGSQEGGSRTSPKENADGTMTVSFNVILVDGLSSTVPGADGSSSINLPSNFQVQKQDELRQFLKDAYQSTNGLAPLPGCPKQMTVKIADREYDASTADLSKGDNCQLNTPTTVSVTLSKLDAQYMLEQALYDNLVDVHAIYETRVSFPVATVNVSFHRQSIYDALQAQLAVKVPPYVDTDVRTAITHVMKSQLMKVEIQGDTSGLLDKLIAQVAQEFFTPFVPDPQDHLPQCSDSMVCLRFSYNQQKQSEDMSFNWSQSTNAETGENYLTWTKLKAIDYAVDVGSSDDTCNNSRHPELCSNFSNKSGSALEEGLTVVAGNLLVIKPDFIVEEARPLDQGTTTRQDNNVCVAQHEIIDHVCSRALHGDETGGLCSDIHTGRYQCDKYEDQWVETTTFYSGTPTWQVVNNPQGKMQELYDGLTLRFKWIDMITGKPQQKDCSLGVFSRLGDGKTLQVHLENVPSCNVFSNNPQETPLLYLVNNIRFSEDFTPGKRVTYWDGRVVQQPEDEQYYPEVRFAGTVSVRGYTFQGVSSHGGI